jgi:hypothetical protein
MGCSSGPDIIQDGLVFCLDPSSKRSYGGSGTSCSDLKGGKSATLENGVAFSNNNAGHFIFDGTDDYIELDTELTGLGACTYSVWLNFNGLYLNGVLGWKYVNSAFIYDLLMYDLGGGPTLAAVYNNTSTTNYAATINNALVSANNWYNITVSKSEPSVSGGFTSSSIKYYLNGSFKIQTGVLVNATGSELGYSGLRTIGSLWNSSNAAQYFWSGEIASVIYYDRVLSADEIRQNYLSTKERFA